MTAGRRSLAGLATAAALGLAVSAGGGSAEARPGPGSYRDGPPPGHTGGFGEPTCRACHFDSPPDQPPGRLEVRAPSEVRSGGGPIVLEVRLTHPELELAGFQLAARFAGEARTGAQAGRLEALDDAVTVDEEGGVQYARHTRAGAGPWEDGRAAWRVRWWPPDGEVPTVALHVAANAANDDDSEFGDRIYTNSLAIAVRPERGRGPDAASADRDEGGAP